MNWIQWNTKKRNKTFTSAFSWQKNSTQQKHVFTCIHVTTMWHGHCVYSTHTHNPDRVSSTLSLTTWPSMHLSSRSRGSVLRQSVDHFSCSTTCKTQIQLNVFISVINNRTTVMWLCCSWLHHTITPYHLCHFSLVLNSAAKLQKNVTHAALKGTCWCFIILIVNGSH